MFVLLLNFISSSSAQLHLMFFWHSAERKENEWKKRRFSSHSKKQNFSHFHSTQSKNAPLSAECRIKTHRKLLKNKKTFITVLKKKLFIPFSHYAREAEIIEKNGHRMCFISEWMIYGSESPSQRALQHWVFVADAANIARVKHCVQLFSQTSDFPIIFFLRHGMLLVSRTTANHER